MQCVDQAAQLWVPRACLQPANSPALQQQGRPHLAGLLVLPEADAQQPAHHPFRLSSAIPFPHTNQAEKAEVYSRNYLAIHLWTVEPGRLRAGVGRRATGLAGEWLAAVRCCRPRSRSPARPPRVCLTSTLAFFTRCTTARMQV